MFTVAIFGYGSRGKIYADNFTHLGIKITAVCDLFENRRKMAEDAYGCKSFSSTEEFFGAGKLADVLVVATLDDQHFEPTIRALKDGYDVILEKPISFKEKECDEIARVSKQTGKSVTVCHVLRYTPFFLKIKELLDTGKFGRIFHIDLTENIGYYHYAHSFVRGPWRNKKTAAPIVLAKSCHDMDILTWLIGKKCTALSSFGDLSFFKKENAPENSAERCSECILKDSCEYSAFKIYLNKDYENSSHLARHGRLGGSDEEIINSLSTDSPYGRCAFKCDNDVYDHQSVNMLFEGGVTAQFVLSAFSQKLARTIRIYCENGEIFGGMDKKKVHYYMFGDPEIKTFELSVTKDIYGSHGGGDIGLVKSFIDNYGKGTMSSDIASSMQSHYMAFAAEKSSNAGGKLIRLKK